MLFAHYKRRGLRVELAREQAKELLYQGRDLTRNQLLIMARQYQTLKDIQAAGTELVISDSALRLNLVYANMGLGNSLYHSLKELVRAMNMEFKNIDVLLNRAVPYQTHGREQGTVEDARKIDEQIKGPFDLVIPSPAPDEVISRLDPLVLPLMRKS
jgi:hypothetical protein